MSFLKKPLARLIELNDSSSSSNTSNESVPSKFEGISASSHSSNYQVSSQSITSRKSDSAINDDPRDPRDRRRDSRNHEAETKEEDSTELEVQKWFQRGLRIVLNISDFEKMDGEAVSFRARIHALRRMSPKLLFIIFRHQTTTIQGVLQSLEIPINIDHQKMSISEDMIRDVGHYPIESIVRVLGKVRKSPTRVKNATIHSYELEVYKVHKLVNLTDRVPFTVYDAEKTNRPMDDDNINEEGDSSSSESSLSSGSDCRASQPSTRRGIDGSKQQRSLPQRFRLNNRIIDLRTSSSQSIFRIQSGICSIFRSYLGSHGFIEIHTPKLQSGATESGATVFELRYFGRPAFLAQSPQLAKQMAITADFERVYEIGPVFRAENSNTPRHLTEYTGLDLEMAIDEHYHETLAIIDDMLKSLWKGIYEHYEEEIKLVAQFYPQERVKWLETTPCIPFADAVQMLIDDGWVNEDGTPPSKYDDLATPAEVHLGRLIKQKYDADYYIVDKFPASARPFYTMPDPTDARITNSFDIFLRGQEILSGGQRIHDANFLEKRLKANGIQGDTMTDYLEGFRWGAPPHAGCGIGLERLTFLFLNLGNIRLASLFPRDPKSLPARPLEQKLRHEEASTTAPPWKRTGKGNETNDDVPREGQLQPLEKLIANYGDAANTSWLDTRYHVWRHAKTGAAQGYIVRDNFAIAIGEPLCAKSQQAEIISAYLKYLREDHKRLKPIWLIVGAAMAEYLGDKLSWRTLACAAEQRVDPRNNPALKDKDLARKIRHAEKEGVKEIDIPTTEPVPEDLRQQIDKRIQDWQRNRKGVQVHLTEIRPWIDQEHRRYYYSQTANGTIQALVVLHQLSPQNGYQVKFSLEFPDAPSGTMESLILHSLKAIAAADPDVRQVTFGTGAMSHLEGGRNMGKYRTKVLKRAYEAINKHFSLTNKSDFRAKMGVELEPVHVCYPRRGLGASGIRAIMGFLEEDG